MSAPVRVSFRRSPSAAEALEGNGEVSEFERFAEEANLEVIRIHPHLRRLIRDVCDTNDGVLGHGISFLPSVVCALGSPGVVVGAVRELHTSESKMKGRWGRPSQHCQDLDTDRRRGVRYAVAKRPRLARFWPAKDGIRNPITQAERNCNEPERLE